MYVYVPGLPDLHIGRPYFKEREGGRKRRKKTTGVFLPEISTYIGFLLWIKDFSVLLHITKFSTEISLCGPKLTSPSS